MCFFKFFKRHRDEALFLTHTPGGFPVGSVQDGRRITRHVQVAPTLLVSGGMAPCWRVYGIKDKRTTLTEDDQ